MLRYLGIAPPYRDFYLPALHAVQSWSIARHGTAFEHLDAAARERVPVLVARLRHGECRRQQAGVAEAMGAAIAFDLIRVQRQHLLEGEEEWFDSH